jgi:hypothetical protein
MQSVLLKHVVPSQDVEDYNIYLLPGASQASPNHMYIMAYTHSPCIIQCGGNELYLPRKKKNSIAADVLLEDKSGRLLAIFTHHGLPTIG